MGEWRQVKIGDFLSARKGKYKPDDKVVAGLQRVDKIDFSGKIHLSEKGSKTDLIMVFPGDLLISGINVAKGAVAVYHGEKPVVATIHYSTYTFDESLVSIDYFRRFVRSSIFEETLKEQVRGGIKTEIKPKDFLPLQINLPGVQTQNKIVKKFIKIENELSELSVGIDSQATLIKQLRQAVLQEAVEGKLTAAWRKQYPMVKGDPQFDAAALLAQIKAEKERLVKEGKIRKEKPLPPITDIDKAFDLPDGWGWCRLEQLGYLLGGGTPSTQNEEYWNGSIAWVCPKDMKTELISDSIDKITEAGLSGSSAKLIPEMSVLFVVRGMILAHTFPVAVNLEPVALNQDMKALVPFESNMEQYITTMLKGYSSRVLALSNTSTHGTKRLDYSQSYGQLPFPLPPLAEQQAIVACVDSLMTVIDELEKQIAERKEQAQLLMQTVLREAFSN